MAAKQASAFHVIMCAKDCRSPRNGSNVLIKMKIMFENSGKGKGKRIIGPCLWEICGKSFDSMTREAFWHFFSGGKCHLI